MKAFSFAFVVSTCVARVPPMYYPIHYTDYQADIVLATILIYKKYV